jgi:hypothetical protein
MGNIAEDFELGEILLILVALGLIGYGIYYVVTNGFCAIFGTCNDSNNPNSANYVEPYSSALLTTLSSPVATIKSIFGIN